MSKTYKYIGNKLTQINLFVTVVIMWLIMSFLYEASVEKKEMTFLRMQTSIMEAAIDLRHEADSELRLKAILLKQPEPVAEKNKLELQSRSKSTHGAILTLLTRLNSLADNPKPFNFTRTTSEQLTNQIDHLAKLANQAKNAQLVTLHNCYYPLINEISSMRTVLMLN